MVLNPILFLIALASTVSPQLGRPLLRSSLLEFFGDLPETAAQKSLRDPALRSPLKGVLLCLPIGLLFCLQVLTTFSFPRHGPFAALLLFCSVLPGSVFICSEPRQPLYRVCECVRARTHAQYTRAPEIISQELYIVSFETESLTGTRGSPTGLGWPDICCLHLLSLNTIPVQPTFLRGHWGQNWVLRLAGQYFTGRVFPPTSLITFPVSSPQREEWYHHTPSFQLGNKP